MNKSGSFDTGRIRLIVFIAAAVLHIAIILLVRFQMEITASAAEPAAGVMRLVTVQEDIPPPAPPPPPEEIPEIVQTTNEAIAETMIETDEVPPPVTAPVQSYTVTEHINYLPQRMITSLPVLPDSEIAARVVYPPIAQRSNIEGTVRLELFIDRYGNIRDVRILRENPEGRGFGEAALNAFRGIRATRPAEANGEPVAVRFQYNLRFTLR